MSLEQSLTPYELNPKEMDESIELRAPIEELLIEIDSFNYVSECRELRHKLPKIVIDKGLNTIETEIVIGLIDRKQQSLTFSDNEIKEDNEDNWTPSSVIDSMPTQNNRQRDWAERAANDRKDLPD